MGRTLIIYGGVSGGHVTNGREAADVYEYRGYLESREKQGKQAVADYEMALALQPGRPQTADTLVRLRAGQSAALPNELDRLFSDKYVEEDPRAPRILSFPDEMLRPGAGGGAGQNAAPPPAGVLPAFPVPEGGGPGFNLGVGAEWAHLRDPSGNVRLTAEDHSAVVQVSVINVSGATGDVIGLMAAQILKSAGASPLSNAHTGSFASRSSISYASTLGVGAAVWPLTLSLVQLDPDHIGAVVVIHRPDISPQQQSNLDLALRSITATPSGSRRP